MTETQARLSDPNTFPSAYSQRQTAIDSKLAMSKALGAAFLNHQVEQLEKSVAGRTAPSKGYRKDNREYVPRSPSKASNPSKKVYSGSDRSRRPPRDSGESEPRTSNEKSPRRRSGENDKDADVVIVDASVLIHGIHHVKRWCREGRQETIIVPLEALNTLDLLKKGLTPLGSRARNASRILEAQVGTNPRIRVQQDDAYVLWDNLDFKDIEDDAGNPAASTSPEWVRRVICCARWELEHNPAAKTKPSAVGSKPKVVLAVCSTADASTRTTSIKLAGADLAPVPGPAPTNPHVNKYEHRSNGSLVSQWAHRVNVTTMELTPTMDHAPPRPGPSVESEERPRARGPPKNKSRTYTWNRSVGAGGKANAEELVERPPAVAAMMEMVSQPRKVIKVLARGEKLDPDT